MAKTVEFSAELLNKGASLLNSGFELFQRANAQYVEVVKLHSSNGGDWDNLTVFVFACLRSVSPGLWPVKDGNPVGIVSALAIAKADLKAASDLPSSDKGRKAKQKHAADALALLNKANSFCNWKSQYADLDSCIAGTRKVKTKTGAAGATAGTTAGTTQANTPAKPAEPTLDNGQTTASAAAPVQAQAKQESTSSPAFSVKAFLANDLPAFVAFLEAQNKPELAACAETLKNFFMQPAAKVVNS